MRQSYDTGRAIQGVRIVGAGLAGSEAAFYLAERGIPVTLMEMRPTKLTEAHTSGGFAELVCSNSLKNKSLTTAPGILKTEMTMLQSLVLRSAHEAEVPSGDSLGVDREKFSELITKQLRSHPNVTIESRECTESDLELWNTQGDITLIATGPLSSKPVTSWLSQVTGDSGLYFYDAIAPILDASTINRDIVYAANRYDRGEEVAYLNCPMSESEYNHFIEELSGAQKVTPKSFEVEKFFQGCQPIEAIAATGAQTLRFGPMKPVGLVNPKTGKAPYAVVQLRPENRSLTAYNMVGFQTKLKYGEQSRVFRLIPGLEHVEFLRLGSIHRNTYVCAPRVLRPDLSLKSRPRTYLAGQITGVEGYLESAACGLIAAMFIEQRVHNRRHHAPPLTSGLGALLKHVIGTHPDHYQPANMHFGLWEQSWFEAPTATKPSRDDWRHAMAEQCSVRFRQWLEHSS